MKNAAEHIRKTFNRAELEPLTTEVAEALDTALEEGLSETLGEFLYTYLLNRDIPFPNGESIQLAADLNFAESDILREVSPEATAEIKRVMGEAISNALSELNVSWKIDLLGPEHFEQRREDEAFGSAYERGEIDVHGDPIE